ncbi:MAG TPA: hypothetical protein VIY50_09075 [Steroidobacteraceae bacterium]
MVDHRRHQAACGTRDRWGVIGSIGIAATRLELQVAPFLDVGDVFSRADASPVSALHKVVGVGFRGVAPPFVVGYVDVGYGSEGAAVFSGIGYPF